MIVKKNIARKTAGSSIHLGKLMLIAGLMLMVHVGVYAQGPSDGGQLDADDTVPFDGGISLLVAAGIAYGARQWRDGRKHGQQEESAGK